MFPKLIAAKPLPDYGLRVTFEDGVEGTIDMSSDVTKGVFRRLADPDMFARICIGELGESIWWNIDAPEMERPDVCADTLYLQVLSPNAEARFAELCSSGLTWSDALQIVREESSSPVLTSL